MKNKFFILFAAAFLACVLRGPALCATGKPLALHVSSTYTNVQFTVYKWSVLKQEGFFRTSSGSIEYNDADLALSKVQFVVQVASIDTRNASRDRVLRSDDFFDVQRYPTMTFNSTTVSSGSEKGMIMVTGDLTIHGVKKRITVPVKLLGINTAPNSGHFAGFETNFTIDRTEFGVNGTRWSGGNLIISNKVLVHLTVGAIDGSCEQLPAQPCN